jgi:hypothetical protein
MATRAERNASWIETYCVEHGKFVCLTTDEKELMSEVYLDRATHYAVDTPIVVGRLAGYVTLLHLAGPEYGSDAPPLVKPDSFTLWNAAGERLRVFLRRDGESIVCDELGKAWKAA